MPFEKDEPAQGPGIRTWQLVKPMCDAGHTVLALCLRTEGTFPNLTEDAVRSEPYPNLTMYNLTHRAFTDMVQMRKIAGGFRPDAIVGAASVLPNYVASRMADLAPFWADCFGDPICEIQAKAELYGKKRCADELFGVWKYYRIILATADHFSSLSDAQNHALIGQLALLGRLGPETGGHRFIDTIPCGVEAAAPEFQKPSPPLLRGRKFPEDAFVVCWSGSYNTWIDTDLLFEGLEEAMERIPRLVFLSIGGGTEGYNENVYEDFCRRIESSPRRERYILCGWVSYEDVPRYYAESDVGINVDRFTYEGVLGSRNRIVQFLRYGLPVVTTSLSEISQRLAQRGLVYTFKMRSPDSTFSGSESLAALLERLAQSPDELIETGRKGQAFVLREYSFARTVRPLLEWVATPKRSPDNAARRKLSASSEPVYLSEIERATDYASNEALISSLLQEKARLDRLRKNPLYLLMRFIKRLMRHSYTQRLK